jgi:DNA-binding protein HU-beta
MPSKPMTKTQLLATLAEQNDLSKKQAADLWDSFVALVYKEVKSSGQCVVPGLGKLVKQDRKARQGRNPATGATITIPAKTVLKFRLAKAAKDAVL